MNCLLRCRFLFLLWLVPLFLLPAACGRKTMPVPPQAVQPTPITDLRYHLDERGVTLIWTAPRRTAGGKKLPGIEGFEIFRAVVPEADACPGCPIPFGPPATYSGDTPQPGETIRYTEPVLRPGHRYFYKVRTRFSWLLTSRDSNMVSFSWDVLPAAPGDLTVAAGDQTLVLSWQAPRALVDGSPLSFPLAYRVERRSGEGDFTVLGEPVAETTFTDRSVRNGVTYVYRVRPLRRVQETIIAGLASEPAAGTPLDLTPPAPPLDLTAVTTPAGVRLLWQAVAEPDLAGYRVYVRPADGQEKQLLGEVTAPQTTFLADGTARAGVAFYSVTAFDQAAPPNESPPSPELEVRF